MNIDQSIFENYLIELKNHLFEGMSLDNILAKVHNNYRARRYVAVYLLKDKYTFHDLYLMRFDFRLNDIFDTVLSAIFSQSDEKTLLKQELIEKLDLCNEMIDLKVEGYPIREFWKDVNSFLMYQRKRSGTSGELLEYKKVQTKRKQPHKLRTTVNINWTQMDILKQNQRALDILRRRREQ